MGTHEGPVNTESLRALLGVGAVVVSALSEWLELSIWRNGNEHAMRFRLGVPEASLAITGKSQKSDGKPQRGTEITFFPSVKFFAAAASDFATLGQELRRLVLANPGTSLVIRDRRLTKERAVILTSGSGTA